VLLAEILNAFEHGNAAGLCDDISYHQHSHSSNQ
jgi:hypothetical protein